MVTPKTNQGRGCIFPPEVPTPVHGFAFCGLFFVFPSHGFLWPPSWTLFPYSNYITVPFSRDGRPSSLGKGVSKSLWLLPSELGLRGVLGHSLLLSLDLRVLKTVSVWSQAVDFIGSYPTSPNSMGFCCSSRAATVTFHPRWTISKIFSTDLCRRAILTNQKSPQAIECPTPQLSRMELS